ncbi:MAG TPA: electron transport complex subunit E [Spirochaetota bacterium]|nr:electron transport complex subunit E [Spirochaetota bacterium]HOM37955.1 electron transport complex subunit E [Spirochaetota bacterium]HPQ48760.1 electron transport complex subunit E [Spirochaetota bacterium]
MKKNTSNWQEFIKGIYKENPVLVSTLGLCPTLAVSTQAINGISMGLSVIIVLTFSNLIISLIKDYVPSNLRIPSYIIVIATFVTILKIIIEGFFPTINKSLGIFIPLIVVNCIILGRAEAFASRNNPLKSVLDGIGMGIGFTIVLTTLSTIREVLGNGTITLKIGDIGTIIDVGPLYKLLGLVDDNGEKAPLVFFLLPPGGFLVLGFLMGTINYLQRSIKLNLGFIKRRVNKNGK